MSVRVTHIADEIEEDGSHRVIVQGAGEPLEVTIPLGAMNELMQRLQVWAIQKSAETNENQTYPELGLKSVGLAHRPTGAELLLSTLQTGYVVLLASDEQLLHFRSEIDRVLSFRNGPATKN